MEEKKRKQQSIQDRWKDDAEMYKNKKTVKKDKPNFKINWDGMDKSIVRGKGE